MSCCSVVTCGNNSKRQKFCNSGVTYHIFPKNPKIKEKWMDATGRGSNWFPRKTNVLCSEHFEEKCFLPLEKSRRLFQWAVPTVKVCKIVSTSILEPVIKSEGKPSIRENETLNSISAESLSSNPENLLSTVNSQPINEPQVDIEFVTCSNDLLEKRRMCEKISQYVNMIKRQRTKIKTLQKKTSRQQQKIKKLEDIIKELKKK